MKRSKHVFLILLVVLTILSLLLSACGLIDNFHWNSNDGKDKDKNKDEDNRKDTDKDKGGQADKIIICHKTGSAQNPYVEIRVPNDAIKDGHGAHEGDLIPAPEGGCP